MVRGLDVDKARAAWGVVGAVLGLTLLFVLYAFIGTFVFGIFIYYATRPVYKRLKRRVRPPSVAAAIALVTLALPFVLLLVYSIAIALQEVNKLGESADFGQFGEMTQPYLNASAVARNPQELAADQASVDTLRTVLEEGLGYVGIIGNGLLHLFIMIALAFYLLRDDHKVSRWVKTTLGDDRGVFDAYVRAVDRDFSSIFFGNILNAFITGIIGVFAYSILNIFAPPEVAIPYAALVGLLAGGASLIPIVGMKLVYFPVAGWLFFRAATADGTGILWFPVAFVAVSFVVVDVIPDLVLRPYVSGRNLHVGSVMLAYILGPLLFGWYGIFLGPILLVLVVHFARLVLPELLASEPVQPYAVDPSYFTEPTHDELADTGSSPVDPGAHDPDPGAEPDGTDATLGQGDEP